MLIRINAKDVNEKEKELIQEDYYLDSRDYEQSNDKGHMMVSIMNKLISDVKKKKE